MKKTLAILFVGYSCFGQLRPQLMFPTVSVLDSRRAISNEVVSVLGFNSPGDWGGPKQFRWDATNTLSTNAIRRGTNAIGRWVHEWDGSLAAFGVIGGTTNDISLSLSNALKAASGKRVYLERGAEYYTEELVYDLDSSVWIDGNGAKIRPTLSGASWSFRNSSDWQANVTALATNLVNLHSDGLTTKETRVLTVTLDASVTAIRGDALFLFSNDRIPGGHSYSATSAGRIGEWLVVGIDATATNVIHFTRTPVESYSTSVRLVKPNQLHRLTVQNLVFDERDDTDPTGTGRTAFVWATGILYPTYENLECYRSYGGAFSFRCCYNGVMDKITGRKLNNIAAYNQLGYLCNDRGSFGCRYSNIRGHVARHLTTTTASAVNDGDLSAPWYNHGASMFGIVRDSVGHAGSNSPFDTHENAYGWTFANLHCIGSFDGNSALGPGLSSRGRGISIRNVLVENCNLGLFLWSGYSNDVQKVDIDNVTVRGAVDSALAIYCGGSGPAYRINDVTIRNSRFEQIGTPSGTHTFRGIYLLSVSNLYAKDCEFVITAPQNGALLASSAGADRWQTTTIWENCKWTIDPYGARPFQFEGGTHVFRNNSFKFTQTHSNSVEAFRVGPSFGTNATLVLEDSLIDISECADRANLITIVESGDSLFGKDVKVATGGSTNTIGWVINATDATSPTITITNWNVDCALNGAWVDSLFVSSNMLVDFVGPDKNSRFANINTSTQLKWPIRHVTLGTLSGDASLYLPKASRYSPGDVVSIINVGSSAYKWTIATNSVASGDTLEGSAVATIESEGPGDKLELMSDGVSSWRVVGHRPRTTRDTTSATSFFTLNDAYSVTANQNPTIITLPSLTSATHAKLLYGTKVGGSFDLHFVPPSGATINGSTNAIVLADTGDAVIFKADLKTTRTNWIVVGSHGLP